MSIFDASSVELSLEEFITSNDKMLSALGFFVAVIALTSSSSNWALKVVAFLSIGGLILIGYEIITKLDKRKLSPLLFLFRYILLWSGIAFILYWLSEFRSFWNAFLWLPMMFTIFGFLLWSLLPIVRHFFVTRKLLGIGAEKKNWFQKLIRFISVVTILIISFVLGFWLAFGTNAILDAIKHLAK